MRPSATIAFPSPAFTRRSAGAMRPAADSNTMKSESASKTILLLRHGATSLNSQRRFIGSTDIHLSKTGRWQLASAARLVRPYNPRYCFSSPMRRCQETAREVLAGSDLESEILLDLREIDFGEWEQKTFEEIQAADQSRIRRWAKFDPAFSFPNGERIGDFVSRVKRVARRISSSDHPSVLVITYGGVIRLLLCQFLGLPARNYLLFEPGPGSLAVVNLFGSRKGTLAALVPAASH
jgi:broad specificity phosphatase PhoE